MNSSDEDPEVVWQGVLEEIVAGRQQGLKCPFCDKGDLTVDDNLVRMRIECKACKRYIEGKLG